MPARSTNRGLINSEWRKHRTITKVEAGRLWLEGFERGTRRAYGPILVPAAATKLLCKGWDLSCALGRVDGTWQIVEVANVYPV